MGWRDRYRQASFRGIPFYVRRAEFQGGRRNQLHIFPTRDVPYSEDLGRSPRIYPIEGYVIGDDYFEQKDDLIRALETFGPGKLVHPYYGDLLLSVRRFRFVDSNTELRMSRVTIEFQESGETLEPTVTSNTKATTDLKKKSALQAAQAAFLNAYSIASRPLAEVNKVRNTVSNTIALVESARRTVANYADYQRKLIQMAADVPGLVATPSQLVEDTIEIFSFGSFPFDGDPRTGDLNPRNMFDELVTLFDIATETPADDTSPVKVMNDLNEQAAVIVAGGLIPEVNYDSFDAANEAAQTVFRKIDSMVSAGIADDDLTESLRDLRDAIVTDIEERSDSLPRLGEVTPPDSIPAMVLSNDLYGDLSEEDGIVTRNAVDHPGFVDGLRPIKVLIGG